MLGDSVKRRQPPAKRTKPRQQKRPPQASGRWKFWLAVGIAIVLPFAVGYVIAVRVLFPPPAVVEEGIPVPSLIGQTLTDARSTVAEAGLGTVRSSDLPSLTAPVGTVIAQSPLPGQQLRASAPMTVAVSSGPPRVLVPDVVGFPVERAASLLVRLGFRVQRIDTVTVAEEGSVVDVNPEPGSQIVLPAQVTILVSLGPPPDTLGQDTLGAGLPEDDRQPTVDTIAGWSAPVRSPIFR